MILHPAIVALVSTSLILAVMSIGGAFFGIRILRRWDLNSGSEEQLLLERRTYLISTIMAYLLIFEIGSLFLFIYVADDLHTLFTGAMCAAGTLYVDPYGYPAFLLKMLNVILAGLWLIVNAVDNRAHDYPLIRKKYALLLVLAPLVLAETVVQVLYFTQMRADVITSCCGSLFSTEGVGIPSDIASLAPRAAMAVFFSVLALALSAGFVFRFTGRLGGIFSFAGGLFFPVACIAFISFISLYFYELPTHRCPFCVLQREYGYVGYLLYGTLLLGVVCSVGVGLLMPFKKIPSLAGVLPRVQKRLTSWGLVSYMVFSLIAVQQMMRTDFTLFGPL